MTGIKEGGNILGRNMDRRGNT